jgi:glycosyltransferase involved in cell wall biosynthesis
MKIVHIIPGSGGTFYCQNCMRDNELITALKAQGNQVFMVPMYLPLNVGGKGIMGDTPVFYGAINIYLKEKLSFYRHVPVWFERLLDSEALLQLAAKKSGSTRATGLEEMTLSMLDGENGKQATELDHLVTYLRDDIKPDVVHLSNALLLGLARRIKKETGAAIICSLQDENEWIDPMSASYQDKVWQKMAERAVDVDAFIAASRYYADRSQQNMAIPQAKMHVVYGGIDFSNYQQSDLPLDPPVIGYLCRMSEYFGLGILVDAFIKLKQETRFKNTKLYVMGGYTGDDKPFVEQKKSELLNLGMEHDVTFFDSFAVAPRIQFLRSLTMLSVPVPGGEAFGAYQVEALASGVPIVEPNVGGYPEFIEATGGGILYEPNTPEKLAEALASLLANPQQLRQLAHQGYKVVHERFTMQTMARKIIDIYHSCLSITST